MKPPKMNFSGFTFNAFAGVVDFVAKRCLFGMSSKYINTELAQ